MLDQALLRAGRFDRQVEVGNPDLAGRLQILKIHSKEVKLAADFDLREDVSQASSPRFESGTPSTQSDESSQGYYFRDQKSVVTRIPQAFAGKGFYIQGNQKQTFPLLYKKTIRLLQQKGVE